MTVVHLELPDAIAAAAEAGGLLAPEAMTRLLARALARQNAAAALLRVPDALDAAGIEPMGMEEIDAEVKAVRAARRRAGGL